MSGIYKLRPSTYIDLTKLSKDLDTHFDHPSKYHLIQIDKLSFKLDKDYDSLFGKLGAYGYLYITEGEGNLFLHVNIFDDMQEEAGRKNGNMSDHYIANKYDTASCRDVALTVMQSIYSTVDTSSVVRLVDEDLFKDMLIEVEGPSKANVVFVYEQ